MKLSRKFLVSLFVLIILAGSGYVYYIYQYSPAQADSSPTIQTARVRTGDIQITASGAGYLVSSSDTKLSFRSGGLLTDLNVSVGDEVKADQMLARLDDTSAQYQLDLATLNLQTLTSPYAVAEAEKALNEALADLEEAQYARLSQQEGNRASESTLDAVKAELLLAEEKVQKAWEKYAPLSSRPEDNLERAIALSQYSTAVEARDAVQRKLNWYLGEPDESDQASLDTNVAHAELRVAAANALLAELRGETIQTEENLAISPDLTQIKQAKLNLENAQETLKNTVLYAPLDGFVTDISANVGEVVNTSPIITITTKNQPLIQFYVEESDLSKIAIGNKVNISFDAYPDQTVEGKIIRLEPALSTIDGTQVLTVWASIDTTSNLLLFSGMAAEVEVIAGESVNTLLVPVQALRELSPGSYAVFVVQPDNQLMLTPVAVGLKDFANAEILSGLQPGDIVSTGTVETK
jgi:HlyD family secretion protein